MTLDEVKQAIAEREQKGLRKIMLVLPRKHPPAGHRVRGGMFGFGEIANCQPKGLGYEVVAWFDIETIKKNIRKMEKESP